MSKDWSYAKMTQEAANGGGPDQWIEAIKRAAYTSGASDMKNALVIPLLAAGASLGAISVIAGQKIKKWIDEKTQEQLLTEQEAALAEDYLKKELAEAIEEIKMSD